MPVHAQTCFSEAILLELPHLRAYARMMTNDLNEADREVEETLKRVRFIDRTFKPSDLRVELLTILRSFLIASEPMRKDLRVRSAIYEKLNRPFRIGNGHAASPLSLSSALVLLDFEDREAVVSAAVGLSRPQAAEIASCKAREHDTRLCRGLARLAELFPGQSAATTSAAEASFSDMKSAGDDRGMGEPGR